MAANYGMGTNHTTTATSVNFIPELWSDEVIGSYKSNLVLANLVTKLSHKGKKGDSINIPVPSRGAASPKDASKQVHLIADTATLITVNINKHYEYSKLIEDIAEVQALASMRKFYTDDAGHALATQVDKDLFAIAQGLNGGAFLDGNGAAYSGTAAAADITDTGIRAMLLKLDNADVPMDNRAMVIPPIAANDLLGQPRFTEQQFIGSGDAIKTGKIGAVYGVDIFISSNCPSVDTNRIGCLFHKDAMVLAEQVGVRSQTQYKQEYLGDLFTADTIYGVAELRDDAGIPFKVKAT